MSEAKQANTPTYVGMGGPQLLDACGDDAAKWAEAFCQVAKTLGHDIDEGWMIVWFANAIEHSYDVRVRRGRPETVPSVQ